MDNAVVVKIAELAADEREAFRAGYLAKMASAGMTPRDVDDALTKRAAMPDMLKWLGLNRVWNSVSGTLTSLPPAVLIGGPIAAGGTAGWAAANLINPTKQDIEIMENEGLASEYKRQTAALKGEVELAERRRKRARRRRSLGL